MDKELSNYEIAMILSKSKWCFFNVALVGEVPEQNSITFSIPREIKLFYAHFLW